MDRRAALRDNHGGSDDEEDGEDGAGVRGDSKRGRGGEAKVLDQWQYCASVLCNAARIPEGRYVCVCVCVCVCVTVPRDCVFVRAFLYVYLQCFDVFSGRLGVRVYLVKFFDSCPF